MDRIAKKRKLSNPGISQSFEMPGESFHGWDVPLLLRNLAIRVFLEAAYIRLTWITLVTALGLRPFRMLCGVEHIAPLWLYKMEPKQKVETQRYKVTFLDCLKSSEMSTVNVFQFFKNVHQVTFISFETVKKWKEQLPLDEKHSKTPVGILMDSKCSFVFIDLYLLLSVGSALFLLFQWNKATTVSASGGCWENNWLSVYESPCYSFYLDCHVEAIALFSCSFWKILSKRLFQQWDEEGGGRSTYLVLSRHLSLASLGKGALQAGVGASQRPTNGGFPCCVPLDR